MIITTAKAKILLQISGSTYDTLITALIPQIQEYVINYCGFPFDLTRIYTTSGITFDESEAEILSSNLTFVTDGFTDAIDVYVQNSYNNDGVYSILTATAGTLTLDNGWNIIEEDDSSPVVTRIRWFKGLDVLVSRMIGEDMQKAKSNGITQESLADWSATYGFSETGYSKSIMDSLNVYRRLKRV